MSQRELKDLPFIDLYVCLNQDRMPHYCQGLGTNVGTDVDVPPEFIEDTNKLTALLRDQFTGVEKGVSYGGMRLRCARLQTATGQMWAAMRRIPELPPKVEKLGLISQLVPLYRSLGSRSGLILMCGATGQGKTTTSTSLLIDYLENFGGVAFTIEDPVEYSLEGRRGKHGYCYQSEINDDSEWGPMLKRSLRWHPKYIVVGEVRTPDAANQLLRAATSGHTVITTLHAGSMEEGLEGLLQLAEADLGDRAALLLASGLTACIHQSMTPLGINSFFMVTEPDNPGSPIRAMIRDKRIGQCRSLADQQMALLMKEGRIFANRKSQ